MKLVIASDHAGFSLKEEVRAYLAKSGHEVIDLGAFKVEPLDDYPDYAERVGEAIKRGEAARGVLICGSGVGVCVAANKIPGIRAGMCHDTYSAHQGVEHDDMNVIVLGARIVGASLAYELVDAFLKAQFIAREERFVRRFKKVMAIEAKYICGEASTGKAPRSRPTVKRKVTARRG
ncbi:MAG TPA: ribose 5-phosphate isomerase B [Terracidiphilus sp.]|nr:ribose 5-phosphate isomerase B [Terracidiphilus sp.]